MLALRRRELERDRLPEKPEELLPDYIERVPRKPFDGQPIRYDPGRRILYAVG